MVLHYKKENLLKYFLLYTMSIPAILGNNLGYFCHFCQIRIFNIKLNERLIKWFDFLFRCEVNMFQNMHNVKMSIFTGH